jgi:integrase
MAKKKTDYASMFTQRKDGRYQHIEKRPDGTRAYIYDRDPERLWHKVYDKPEPVATTFREVAESWEVAHRDEIEPRTWNNYKPHYNDILSEHGDKAFSEVEPGDIVADLARAKARGLGRTVVQSRRSIWRMIYDHAVIIGEAKYNPVYSIKLPKGLQAGKRSAPTKEQMDTICSNVDAPFGLFPFMLLCTGLRKSEALALQWNDIDFAANEIRITKSIDYTCGSNPKYKAPKTAAGVRDVPILDILKPYLIKEKAHAKSIYVFPCPPSNRGGLGGGLMTDRGYDGAWQRYCESVGFIDENNKPTLTAHQLRHGTATLMFELGVDEMTAQHIMGHSRVEITREIYTELRVGQKSKSVAKFNKGMSKMLSNVSGK